MEDAKLAYEAAVANGAVGVQPPTTLTDEATGTVQARALAGSQRALPHIAAAAAIAVVSSGLDLASQRLDSATVSLEAFLV